MNHNFPEVKQTLENELGFGGKYEALSKDKLSLQMKVNELSEAKDSLANSVSALSHESSAIKEELAVTSEENEILKARIQMLEFEIKQVCFPLSPNAMSSTLINYMFTCLRLMKGVMPLT